MDRVAEGGGESEKKNKKKMKSKRRSVVVGCMSVSCFKPSVSDQPDTVAAAPVGSGTNPAACRPTHLVVTVNGIVGSAADWSFAAKQFVKKYPEDIIVHCSQSNSSSLTFDGVDVMGERLAKEVTSVISQRPELQKISFVAHSLGGLVARYAIGRLYSPIIVMDSSEENGDVKIHKCGTQCPEEVKGKIAGLEPVNFITFATPHLGCRSHKQIPVLCGSYALEKMSYHICSIAGRTGRHLFLKDHDEGKPPLLLQMVNDCGDLQFISALQSFKRRVAYSNVCFDFIVGRKTSSIRPDHEIPKRPSFTKNERYPHIVYEEKPKTYCLRHEGFIGTKVSQPKTTEMEEAMLLGLNRVTWERIDVSFRKSKQRISAHSTIQVKNYSSHSDGADVIFHMIDNFLL
ncbi:uncharacterized protein M6B38_203505 [Iris pallida]|uniref:DUF676 domain-containing protein n=1 Tax=Iris pallida TaxID=29817 RepID=A0AAX6E725_IRIPA|nr:uncharacterized protein M6B38_203505 [Iris pallida]